MSGHFEENGDTPRRAMPKLWSPATASEDGYAAPGGSRSGLPLSNGSGSVNEPLAPLNSFRSPRGLRRAGPPARAYVTLPYSRAGAAPKKQAARTAATPRYTPTIKELPESDRPRERLQNLGSQALTSAELLAILIQQGNSERNAVSLGEVLIAHFGSVNELASASVDHLATVKGIGPAKATQIKAAIEFGKRIGVLGGTDRPMISGPQDVYNLLASDLRYLKKETLRSILLNAKHQVIGVRTVSIGDLTSSIVHPREVFKDAIIASANALVLAHNHPSGDPTPSADDITVTRRIKHSGEILGIELVDHIIIGDATFASLQQRGLL
jgi:DNA repair protein RadC